MTPFASTVRNSDGFTLIELLMVLVIIGALVAAGAQRFIDISEDVEITAEDATIETMRNNLVNNYADALVKKQRAVFPANPFANMRKIPDGYDQQRNTPPIGALQDDGIWTFSQGSSSTNLTPQQAGTTLNSFQTTGFIYHQRKDHTVVKWPYDAVNGVIGRKIIQRESALKQQSDINRRIRGEPTERDQIRSQQRSASGINR